MPNKLHQRRVVMAKRIAERWIRKVAHAEHRFDVLLGAREVKNLPNLLRAMRDGKVALEGVPRVASLGIQESFDSLTLWSGDREAMVSLKDWFEKRGFETTGIW